MKTALLTLLRCPDCGSTLSADGAEGEIGDGSLVCTGCGRRYEVRDRIPLFVPGSLSEEVSQVQDSYTAKWDRVSSIYDEDNPTTAFMQEWYLRRYKWGSRERLAEFLAGHERILDTGCGLGRDVRFYASLHPNGTVVGADLSGSVFHAAEKSARYPNVDIIQADLNRLPFEPASFDFVACDQVLPCVEDPRASVERLWSLVKPGGHFAFYVYRRKSVIREFTDDHLRAHVTQLTPEQGWEVSERITRLGKALAEVGAEIEVPDLPELDIRGGTWDVQRFFFYNVLKCFWNDDMTWDENVVVNFDWFHPAYTYRHTVEEVRGWTDELGMDVLVLDEDEPSGISVLARKP